MKTLLWKLSTALKMIFKILDIVTESGFVLQFFEAAINLAPIDVLCILDDQYIIKSDLSSSVKFRSNFLQ